ncbi:lycopene cyclase family protein [Kitasatospora sp. NPDC001159]
MTAVDIAVIGSGAAGLLLADELTRPGRRTPPSVALLELPSDDPRRPPPRTWCFWERDAGRFDELLAGSWDSAGIVSSDGRVTRHPLAPLRYKMLRSPDVEVWLNARPGGAAHLTRVIGTAGGIADSPAGAVVAVDGAHGPLEVRARWVFDSRPRPPRRDARTTLRQHFHGWFVEADLSSFDPRLPLLMDFRVPQPAAGLAFGYVLPTSERHALVEYTVFSRDPWPAPAYDRALRTYLGQALGVGSYRVEGVEHGVIPMTDATFPRQESRHVFRIGTAGGATRPATGYTFTAALRQARAVARAVDLGARPVPPRPHRRRHLAMDAVLLHAIDTGRIGPAFFTGLFRRNRAATVLRFLDGDSGLLDELAIGLSCPFTPMLRTCLDLPARRPRGSSTDGPA